MSQPPKKRNRISLTCTMCKKRRVRCDKRKPACTACMRHNVSHLCEYDESSWAKSQPQELYDGDVMAELEFLRNRIRELESNELGTVLENDNTFTNETSIASIALQSDQEVPKMGKFLPPIIDVSVESVSSFDTETDPFGVYGVNPSTENDTICFYDGFDPINTDELRNQNRYGPFTWITILQKDVFLGLVWRKVADSNQLKNIDDVQQSQTQTQPENSQSQHTQPDSKVFVQPNVSLTRLSRTRSSLGPIKRTLRAKSQLSESTSGVSASNSSLEAFQAYDSEFNGKILKTLPQKTFFWSLVDRFFNFIYPFTPFVDETDFKSRLGRILGKRNNKDEAFSNLKLDSKEDVAFMGLVLVVIRLAHRSLYPNESSNQETLREDKHLSRQIIPTAQLCISQLSNEPTTMTFIQCVLFLKENRIYSPEEGDKLATGGESHFTTGQLVQLMKQYGLCRDPYNVKHINDHKQANLWRKIWLEGMRLDTFQGVWYGNPMNIRAQDYDTRRPEFKEQVNSNLRDLELERVVVEGLTWIDEIAAKQRFLCDLMLNVGERTSLDVLNNRMTELETFSFQKFGGSLQQLLARFRMNTSPHTVEKVYQLRLYLETKSFLNTMYFYVFKHHEESNNDLSFFFLKKMLINTNVEILDTIVTIVNKPELYFDDGYGLYMAPFLIKCCHKAIQFNIAVLIRAKIISFNTRENTLVAEFGDKLMKTTERTMGAISRLNGQYFSSWRTTKLYSFLMTFLDRESLIEEEDSFGFGGEASISPLIAKNVFDSMNGPQMTELLAILEEKEVIKEEISSPREPPLPRSPASQLIDPVIERQWFQYVSTRSQVEAPSVQGFLPNSFSQSFGLFNTNFSGSFNGMSQNGSGTLPSEFTTGGESDVSGLTRDILYDDFGLNDMFGMSFDSFR